jgi:hypothetical protein
MTAQIPDTLIYNGDRYRIIGLKGAGLPTPADFEMETFMMSTACYRGYYAQYSIQEDQLVLSEITLRAREGNYKPIQGIEPETAEYGTAGCYSNLHVPVHFSGGLLLGKDFIDAMYVHMGFQKPTSFEVVIELLVEDGHISRIIDHSEKIAAMREDILKPRPKPGFDDPTQQSKQIENWIAWTFSLDYDL